MNNTTTNIIFKSKTRWLRTITFVGVALFLLLIIFLFSQPKTPFLQNELGTIVFLSIIELTFFGAALYLIHKVIWPASLRITSQGFIIKHGLKPHLFLQWQDLETIIVVNMKISARGYSYHGYKLLLKANGKQVASVTSFDIGNFDKLLACLTAEKCRPNIKFYLQNQFKEKAFVAKIYAATLWLLLFLAVSSIFLNENSRHFIL